MKNGKKPTRDQKSIMKREKLKSGEWLVERNTSTEVVFVNVNTGETRSVSK